MMPETLIKNTQDLLKELWKEGITKGKVCEETGMGRPTLDRLINGDVEKTTLSVFIRLFKHYGKYAPNKEKTEKELQNINDLILTNKRLVRQLEILLEENERLKSGESRSQ